MQGKIIFKHDLFLRKETHEVREDAQAGTGLGIKYRQNTASNIDRIQRQI
jgi:hypothetical protein